MAKDPVQRLADELKSLSDAELAARHNNSGPGSLTIILADKEFERRARVEQHELNMKLMAEQERWMKSTAKVSAWVTLAAALIGATAGVLLTFWLQGTPPPMKSEPQKTQVQTQSEPSTSIDRKEKPESVPSNPPKSN